MTKAELAGYMASLQSLMEGQDSSGVHNRSKDLGDEYNRCWAQLKEMIRKDQGNGEQSEDTSNRRV